MRYIVDIKIEDALKRSYKIDAKDEDEALERLKLRLPPNKRESFSVLNISLDPSSIRLEEPYGIFNEE